MTSKKLLVLGATGGTGQQVVAQAVARGYAVTAFVREPQRLAIGTDRIRVLVGDVARDDSALTAAARDQDVVISTLGVGKSFKSGDLIAHAAPNIVRAMNAAGVRRLIFTSAFGVGESRRDVPLIPRIFIRLFLKDVYRDKTAGEAVVRASSLDWTIAYPVGLGDGLSTGKYRAGERLALSAFPRMRRADLAAFLLDQIDDAKYIRTGVLVSS